MLSETRAALADFMERSGKSQRQISRETGLSTSVISQFLNGCYAGDNEEVAKSINQYLTIGEERLNTVSKTPFYPELYNTREVLFTCLYAHQHNDITLVSGDAGAGKNNRPSLLRRNEYRGYLHHGQCLYHIGYRRTGPDLSAGGASGSGPESGAHEYAGGAAGWDKPPDYH